MTLPLLEALEEHAATLRRASHLYVGFSGGKDSHSLLHALVALNKRSALPSITAIHVNHGLHPDAGLWEQHCCDVAQDLDVEIKVDSVVVGSDASLEAQARNARYDAFKRYMTKDAILLLAHHLDDQVETIMFRLIRGAGAAGLSGIPESRALGAGKILRPFLGISRSEIEDYSSALSLESIEDPSNLDTSLDRNFLRHQVLPLIAARWPGYRSGIARTGQIMGAIDKSFSDHWYECSLGALSLDVNDLGLEALHTQVRSKLTALRLQTPAYDALKEFCRQCIESRADKTPSLKMGAYGLFYWRDRVQLISTVTGDFEPEEVRVGDPIERPWGRLTWETSDTGLTPDSVVGLRSITPGERVKFRGRPNRSLRDCMQEASIAPYWRVSVPIVCSGGQVIAVPGIGCTDHGTPFFNGNSEGLVPVWKPPKIRIGN